jgi:putative addiction module component (TIGR02574 family)
MAAPDVLDQILELPAEERARLALELIRSLDAEDENAAGVAAAWDDELGRRVAEIDAGTAETVTLQEYRDHVRRRRAARAAR